MATTQNVSAQLFTKQLHPDELASYYGCYNVPVIPYLTTCVDPIVSDAQIENAFQKQMNLADYYKGKSVFETMKRDFMDQVMGKPPEDDIGPPQEEPSKAEPVIPVGPRDFLFDSISHFGPGGNCGLFLAAIFVFLAFFIAIRLKK
jgi:hypothetical protein